MKIWKITITGKMGMLLFLQLDPTKSVGSLFRRSIPGEPLAFKTEKKWQHAQKEEFPVQAMVALKIAKKCHTERHHPYISLLGDR